MSVVSMKKLFGLKNQGSDSDDEEFVPDLFNSKQPSTKQRKRMYSDISNDKKNDDDEGGAISGRTRARFSLLDKPMEDLELLLQEDDDVDDEKNEYARFVALLRSNKPDGDSDDEDEYFPQPESADDDDDMHQVNDEDIEENIDKTKEHTITRRMAVQAALCPVTPQLRQQLCKQTSLHFQLLLQTRLLSATLFDRVDDEDKQKEYHDAFRGTDRLLVEFNRRRNGAIQHFYSRMIGKLALKMATMNATKMEMECSRQVHCLVLNLVELKLWKMIIKKHKQELEINPHTQALKFDQVFHHHLFEPYFNQHFFSSLLPSLLYWNNTLKLKISSSSNNNNTKQQEKCTDFYLLPLPVVFPKAKAWTFDWLPFADELLALGVSHFENKSHKKFTNEDWKYICARYLPHKTPLECRKRWTSLQFVFYRNGTDLYYADRFKKMYDQFIASALVTEMFNLPDALDFQGVLMRGNQIYSFREKVLIHLKKRQNNHIESIMKLEDVLKLVRGLEEYKDSAHKWSLICKNIFHGQRNNKFYRNFWVRCCREDLQTGLEFVQKQIDKISNPSLKSRYHLKKDKNRSKNDNDDDDDEFEEDFMESSEDTQEENDDNNIDNDDDDDNIDNDDDDDDDSFEEDQLIDDDDDEEEDNNDDNKNEMKSIIKSNTSNMSNKTTVSNQIKWNKEEDRIILKAIYLADFHLDGVTPQILNKIAIQTSSKEYARSIDDVKARMTFYCDLREKKKIQSNNNNNN